MINSGLNNDIGLEGIGKPGKFSNAGGCSAPTDTAITNIQDQISVIDTKINVYSSKYDQAKNKVGTVGGCGFGRSVDHWWEKHVDLKLPTQYGIIVLGKNSYCEPNFIDAVVLWYFNSIKSLQASRQTLQTNLQQAQASYDAAMDVYTTCITEEATATALVQETDPAYIEAQAQAELLASEAKMEEAGKKTQNTVMLLVAVVLVLIIAAMAFRRQKA